MHCEAGTGSAKRKWARTREKTEARRCRKRTILCRRSKAISFCSPSFVLYCYITMFLQNYVYLGEQGSAEEVVRDCKTCVISILPSPKFVPIVPVSLDSDSFD